MNSMSLADKPSAPRKPQQLEDSQPWYRQFWPWVLIGLPMSAVIAGIITVIIAVSNRDSLVVGDYYKQGKAINLQREAGQRAAALGLDALLRFDGNGRALQLLATGEQMPDQLHLQLLHPTHADRDRSLQLQRDASGYNAELAVPLQKARWYLRLQPTDARWRLSGELNYPHSRSVRLQPALD